MGILLVSSGGSSELKIVNGVYMTSKNFSNIVKCHSEILKDTLKQVNGVYMTSKNFSNIVKCHSEILKDTLKQN